MAWREVSPDPAPAPTSKEIVQAMIRPRTMSDMWAEYVGELRDRDDGELPADYEEFNLNKPNTMEMK
jgi:hypothetical protein